jgi:hypothetical protein
MFMDWVGIHNYMKLNFLYFINYRPNLFKKKLNPGGLDTQRHLTEKRVELQN